MVYFIILNRIFPFLSKQSSMELSLETINPKSFLQFSCSVVSNSLRPHGLQHARLVCPSLPPRVCSNSYLLSWWCYPTISSSVTLFSSCPQFSPKSGPFPVSQLFVSGDQIIRASVSAWVLNEYSGLISFRIDWFHLLAVQGSQVSSPMPQFKRIIFLMPRLLYGPTLTSVHNCTMPIFINWIKWNTIALTSRFDLGWQSDVCFLIHWQFHRQSCLNCLE